MVFGVKETEKADDVDENFIKGLINDVVVVDVEVDANVKFVTRIGDRFKKARLIKVILENSHQRYLLINSLVNLKGKKAYQKESV